MKQAEFDVVVVGAGGAGLMAAIAAADAGAKVLQIEKSAILGGTFRITGGSSAGAGTRMQAEAGILTDNAEQFYKECMQGERARAVCDPDVLWYYCQNAGSAIDWLDSKGAYPDEFRVPRDSIYGEPWTVKRSYFPNAAMAGGKRYLDVLIAEHEKRMQRGDVKVSLNTSMTDLIKVERQIVGIKAKGIDETELNFFAKSVILCTGGFGNNPRLVRSFKWPDVKDMVSIAAQTATGEGLEAAQRIGAKLVNMEQKMAPCAGGVVDPKNSGRCIANANLNRYPGAIWVDLTGKRFVNEDAGERVAKTRLAIQAAPEMKAIVILDKKIKNENDSIFFNMYDGGKGWDKFDQMADEGILVKKAETVEELAEKLGLDTTALSQTVKTYNGYVSAGMDGDFGRQELQYRIENPPYYAFVVLPIVVMTSGGPANNAQQQVLDTAGEVIPGLYAAGEIAGYKAYGTGAGNTGCLVFGKRAGEEAARYALGRV